MLRPMKSILSLPKNLNKRANREEIAVIKCSKSYLFAAANLKRKRNQLHPKQVASFWSKIKIQKQQRRFQFKALLKLFRKAILWKQASKRVSMLEADSADRLRSDRRDSEKSENWYWTGLWTPKFGAQMQCVFVEEQGDFGTRGRELSCRTVHWLCTVTAIREPITRRTRYRASKIARWEEKLCGKETLISADPNGWSLNKETPVQTPKNGLSESERERTSRYLLIVLEAWWRATFSHHRPFDVLKRTLWKLHLGFLLIIFFHFLA